MTVDLTNCASLITVGCPVSTPLKSNDEQSALSYAIALMGKSVTELTMFGHNPKQMLCDLDWLVRFDRVLTEAAGEMYGCLCCDGLQEVVDEVNKIIIKYLRIQYRFDKAAYILAEDGGYILDEDGGYFII